MFGKKIRHLSLYTTGASILLCAILLLYGALHARSINTVNYNLTLPGKSAGLRIALISDLHIGSSVGKLWIQKIVDTINRTQPDIVLIAGDIFDGNLDVIGDLPGVVSQLKRISAPLGVYACLGNHDVDRMRIDAGTKRIEDILKEADIVLLQDEVRAIRDSLYITGRKDARPIGMSAQRKSADELLAGSEGTIIMLDHQPVQFLQNEKAGVDFLLCGHTHKGQLFPANLITRGMFKKMGAVHYGYWKGETMQAVVTSGAGVWGPPLRVATNSEVAVIDVNFVQ